MCLNLKPLTKALLRIAEASEGILEELKKLNQKPQFHFTGGEVQFGDLTQQGDKMIRTQDDHADQPITLDPVTATDAEGNAVPLTNDRLESTDKNVVDPNFGGGLTLHIGVPGSATVNRKVTDDEGTEHTVFSANFAISAGPPASFTGGGATFGDLTDTP